MRIDVLPLRKLPNSVAILSYESPEPVTVGQLVEIPFRGRPMLGVVWDTNSTYEGKTQSIKKVFPNAVMNSIQRALIEQLQTTHAVSAASLLYQHWPANRVVQKLLVPDISSPAPKATHTYSWYANREQILTEQTNYISELHEVTAILVPTHEHAKEWQAKFPEALVLTSESSAKERNVVYQKTSSGEARIVIGTADLLFLPYTTWPVWIIDDEEHQSHKQSQAPYLDARRALDHFPGHHVWLSPAPTVRRWQQFRPLPPSDRVRRVLGRLDQGANAPWISWEAESAINELPPDAKIHILLPRKNFATRLGCTNCGWSVACTSCGNAIRWNAEHNGKATCGFCQQEQSIPSNCEQCGQAGVQAIGLHDQTIRQSIQKLFPDRRKYFSLSAYFDPIPDDISALIHASGDALLQFPDIAAEDRCYQLLQHIASRSPHATHVLQTYDPSFRLWPMWSLHDDTNWYTTIWQERQDLHLPPAQPALLARYRGLQPDQALKDKQRDLEAIAGAQLQVMILPTRQKTSTQTPLHRILISCRDGANPTTRIDWRLAFPHPWAVDMAPDSWLV